MEIKLHIKKVFFNTIYMLKILLRSCKGLAIFEFLMHIIRGLIPLVEAYLAKIIINSISDRYVYGSQEVTFYFLLLIVATQLAMRILYEYLQVLSTKTTIIASHKISMEIQQIMLNKMKDLDRSFFDYPKTLDIIQRASYFDSNAILQTYRNFMGMFRTLPAIIGAVIILWNFEWFSALLAIALYIPLLYVERSKVESMSSMMTEITELERKQSYYSNVVQDKAFAKESRIYGFSNHFIDKYSKTREQLFRKKWKLNIQNDLKEMFVNTVKTVVEVLFYAYLVYLAIEKAITVGDIMFLHTAFTTVGSELKWNIQDVSDFAKNSILVEYFQELLNLENEIITGESRKFPILPRTQGQHSIEFIDVSFTYPGSKEPAIKDISFKLNTGQSLGIVGLNGSGKTTIAKLLLHLYNCDRGKILIDGRDISGYNPEDYYVQWGALMQDYNIYSMNVAQNIALGKDEIDMERVRSASEFCCVSDFIEVLPLKYETNIGRQFYPDGYEPSQGQAQRIAFARAFYEKFELLILDEPSASIDTESEYKIFNNINRLSEKGTSIFISHKLTNVMDLDKIIVLDRGKIVESGTHEELIRHNGEYARLYKMQSERYIENSKNQTVRR